MEIGAGIGLGSLECRKSGWGTGWGPRKLENRGGDRGGVSKFFRVVNTTMSGPKMEIVVFNFSTRG